MVLAGVCAGGVWRQLSVHDGDGKAYVCRGWQPIGQWDRPEHGAGDGRASEGCDFTNSHYPSIELHISILLVPLAYGPGPSSLFAVGEFPGPLVHGRAPVSPRGGERKEAAKAGATTDEKILILVFFFKCSAIVCFLIIQYGTISLTHVNRKPRFRKSESVPHQALLILPAPLVLCILLNTMFYMFATPYCSLKK